LPKKELDYFDQITKREVRNIQKTEKYISKDLELYKKSFNMLFHAFKLLTKSYSEKWSHSKRAIYLILPRIIMSTKTSVDLLTRGYYFDHIVVERSLMESVALLTLFSRNEAAAKKWLTFEEVELPKWKLMHQLFSSPTKKLIALVNKSYAEQSHFVHSSFAAIITEFSRHLKKEFLQIPRFRKSLIADALDAPPSLLVLLILVYLYKEEMKKDFSRKVTNLIAEKITKWEAMGLLSD